MIHEPGGLLFFARRNPPWRLTKMAIRRVETKHLFQPAFGMPLHFTVSLTDERFARSTATRRRVASDTGLHSGNRERSSEPASIGGRDRAKRSAGIMPSDVAPPAPGPTVPGRTDSTTSMHARNSPSQRRRDRCARAIDESMESVRSSVEVE